MSADNKNTVRVFFWIFLVIGVMFSPFFAQDYVWHVCRQEFETTRDVGNCYWNIQYGSDIYE